jgi:murein DD-endopeptidase MepM/ murein hydrolase activator NlpD
MDLKGKQRWEDLKKQLTHKFRLIVFDADTYEEIGKMSFTRFSLIIFGALSFVVVIGIVVTIIIYTPLHRLLPAYTDSALQRDILTNAAKVDSLERQIQVRDQYFDNLKKIIQGKVPENVESGSAKTVNINDINLSKSKHDSVLRKEVEKEEQYNVPLVEDVKSSRRFANLHFFIPVKGLIVNKFNSEQKHFAIDIVAAPNQAILSVLEGTVIAANWTLATGYVIEVQHDNNLVSFYKHNSALLKEVGDHVSAGETIAIIGNTGELTTGPHLHFELWHNGTPLNPEDYLIF